MRAESQNRSSAVSKGAFCMDRVTRVSLETLSSMINFVPSGAPAFQSIWIAARMGAFVMEQVIFVLDCPKDRLDAANKANNARPKILQPF